VDSCGFERTIESCGTCGDGEACTDGACVCVPETDAELCADAGFVCGELTIVDACGFDRTVVSCGGCGTGTTCEEGACVVLAQSDAELCQDVGATCGAILAEDATGEVRRVASCGTCGLGEVCGEGGANLCGASTWEWEAPSTADDLLAVHALDADTVFTVGSNGTILRTNGGTLTKLQAPTRARLLGVWASDVNDAWAVGEGGTLLHFDGISWATSHLHDTSLDLVGIAGTAEDDVWAIGRDATSSTVLHWDGATWSTRDAGLASGDLLHAVVADTTLGVWAAGDAALVVRWDDVNETFERESTSGLGGTNFRTLWADALASPPKVWAAGTQGGPTDVPDIWQFTLGSLAVEVNNTTFNIFGDYPLSLWGHPGSHPFLLTRGASVSRVYEFGGNFWHTTPTLQERALAMHGGGGSLFLAGERGSLLEDDGTQRILRTEPAPSCNRVTGVAGHLWAGCGASVLEWDGSGNGWQALPALPLTNPTVQALWAGSPTELWVVARSGSNSYVHTWDGVGWTERHSLSFETVMTIWGDGSVTIWIGGNGANVASWRVRSFDGTTWTNMGANISASVVRGLWGAPSGELFAAATAGNLYRHDGTAWVGAKPSSANFHALHGSDTTNVWAVGAGGQAFQWNGQAWTRKNAGTRDLDSVYVASPTDVYALNVDGVLYHWDGTDWSTTRLPQPSTGKAVWVDAAGQVLVVGNGIQRLP
jgi:hypothetical protein